MNRVQVIYTTVAFLLSITGAVPARAAAESIDNPQPCVGDLILPMPNGAEMVFRPVFIGQGNKPFVRKELHVGKGFGIDKEERQRVRIHGSFQASNAEGEPDWVYYLGKYEVSEAQYYAVMDPKKGSASQNPITNLSEEELEAFIQKYNTWLFGNSFDALPRSREGSRGFLRLPSEVEWEFAARGGGAVSAELFAKHHPYPGPLNKYEWFSGPESSHDKIKKIGTRRPNPLFLHDMLGNVSELVTSFNTGALLARGGNYYTSKIKVRASLRRFLGRTVGIDEPAKQPTLGFRLLISSNDYVEPHQSAEFLMLQDDFLDICHSAELALELDLQCVQRAARCRDESFDCMSAQLDEFLEKVRQEVEKY